MNSVRDRPVSFRPFSGQMWLWWVLSNLLGGAIVGGLEARGLEFFATLILTGPILGGLQWLVLRTCLHRVRWWAIATTVGWLVGIQLSLALDAILDPLISQLVSLTGLWEVFWLNILDRSIVLAIVGIAQALTLRTALPFSGWWIGASIGGGAVNGALGATVCAVGCRALDTAIGLGAGAAASYGAGWLGYGIVTGLVLMKLTDQRR